MPTYIAKKYLVQNGKVVQTGGEIELTEEQAKKLGEKVTAAKPKKAENDGADLQTEASLKKLGAEEQKVIVEKLGGDLEELTNEEKRIAFILENQNQE